MPVDKKEERMWQLADELADSGDYQGYQAIEWELRSRGYPRARSLMDIESVRQRYDERCAKARKGGR
jgi:hypothetical protein